MRLEGERMEGHMYRHHQFRSGLATEQMLQGSALGPESRAVRVRYGYHNPGGRVRVEFEGSLEGHGADSWETRYNPLRDVYKTEDLPDQVRTRLQGTFTHWLHQGAGMLLVRSGVERVRNPTYPVAGPPLTNVAVLVQLRWAF